MMRTDLKWLEQIDIVKSFTNKQYIQYLVTEHCVVMTTYNTCALYNNHVVMVTVAMIKW